MSKATVVVACALVAALPSVACEQGSESMFMEFDPTFSSNLKVIDAPKETLELVEHAVLEAGALAQLNAKALELGAFAYEVNDVYKQTAPAE